MSVLEQVAADLAGTSLDEEITRIIADDILRVFRLLLSSSALISFAIEPLARFAFSIAITHSLPLSDAFAVTLAGTQGVPLLIADDATYRTLRAVAEARPNLRLAWLPDRYRDQ